MGIENLVEALEWCGELRENAREIFENDGKLDPVAFIGMSKNPETGEEFGKVEVAMIPVMVDFDSVGKDQFTGILRMVAVKTAAVAIVTINEIWMVSGEGTESLPRGSLEHVAGRKEAIMVIMEHKGSGVPHVWIAEIKREGESGILGEFNEIPREGKPSGRFIGILGGAYN